MFLSAKQSKVDDALEKIAELCFEIVDESRKTRSLIASNGHALEECKKKSAFKLDG